MPDNFMSTWLYNYFINILTQLNQLQPKHNRIIHINTPYR